MSVAYSMTLEVSRKEVYYGSIGELHTPLKNENKPVFVYIEAGLYRNVMFDSTHSCQRRADNSKRSAV